MSSFGLRRRNLGCKSYGVGSVAPWGIKPHYQETAEMVKKFYAGAKHIGAAIKRGHNAECTRATVDEAIADAKNAIRNGEADVMVVVEIVAIVRRDHPPITVEVLSRGE